jgi:hypothetical protein
MMNRYSYQSFLCLLLVMFCACETASTSSNPSAPIIALSPTPSPSVSNSTEQSDYKPKYLDDFNLTDESLSFGDYRVETRTKPITIEGKKFEDGLNYGVLRKRDKIIAQFDGIYHPAGTSIRFGLVPLLGEKAKQLIVEQATHRNWRYWVVNLDHDARITFDSGKYPVGQDLRIFDIDGDGKEELILSSLTFWFFERLTNVDSPFIDIVFSYDLKQRKYVPANQRFQNFVLRDVEGQTDKLRKITPPEWKGDVLLDGGLLSTVLEVMLPYIYVGKKQEAWTFYETWYNLPDKVEMKSKIEKRLNGDSLYRTIYP